MACALLPESFLAAAPHTSTLPATWRATENVRYSQSAAEHQRDVTRISLKPWVLQ